MKKAVVAYLVAIRDDPVDELGVEIGVLAQHKKGCLDALFLQRVEYLGCAAGTCFAVKGQGHMGFLAVSVLDLVLGEVGDRLRSVRSGNKGNVFYLGRIRCPDRWLDLPLFGSSSLAVRRGDIRCPA